MDKYIKEKQPLYFDTFMAYLSAIIYVSLCGCVKLLDWFLILLVTVCIIIIGITSSIIIYEYLSNVIFVLH